MGHGETVGYGHIFHFICNGMDVVHDQLGFSCAKSCYNIHIRLYHIQCLFQRYHFIFIRHKTFPPIRVLF